METKISKLSLITIYDNYQINSELKTGWGFSCLVRQSPKGEGGSDLLFDTGADSLTLFSNMEKLKVDPQSIDLVFISHMHGDHTGGLQDLLEVNKDLKLYNPDSFSRPTKIFKNAYSTGCLGGWIKEQSLILNTEKGLVIITGCSHPGIVNIIKRAKEIFPKEDVYLVLGGFHLAGASDSELQSIIQDFRRLGVQKTAPCHCSGDRTRELFKQEYQDDFIENGVGKIIKI